MNFKTKTNWVVITGAPSSGKTSVIQALESRGYTVQPEVARALIEKKLAEGLTLEQIRGTSEGYQSLQQEILAEKVRREDRQDPEQLIFIDRGTGDSVSYYRTAGLDPELARAVALDRRYRAVFFFDRLPLVHDAVRNESEEAATRIDREMEADYRALGYDVVRVPVMPVEARADFVLDALERKAA